jgi:hypothetical protein
MKNPDFLSDSAESDEVAVSSVEAFATVLVGRATGVGDPLVDAVRKFST